MSNEYTSCQTAQRCGGSGGGNGRGVPLAMAYVRDQDWEKPMNARDALNCGSAFRSLVMPFTGKEECGNE